MPEIVGCKLRRRRPLDAARGRPSWPNARTLEVRSSDEENLRKKSCNFLMLSAPIERRAPVPTPDGGNAEWFLAAMRCPAAR